MKKYLLFLVFVSFCVNNINAKHIKLATAKTIAGENVALAYTAKTGVMEDFYVFNKTSHKGFVIVSAEDNTEQAILGYSDTENFDYDRLPENLKWWLGEYQKQIEWARANDIPVRTVPARTSADVIVAPLLGDNAWTQHEPYNNFAPMDGSKRCVAGCVALAMSQIMTYHKWPLQGKGGKSYSWKGTKLSVDFSQSKYDFSKILPRYLSGQYTQDQSDAVAKLVYDCGISTEMNYGTSASSTYASYAVNALTTYFDYSSDVRYQQRSSYYGNWDVLLKNELDAFRPILYSASDTKEGGHAFVCDGYDREGYFHFNFGWGGIGNGYYLSSAINPEQYKFNDSQAVIYGIHANNKKKVSGLYYNIINDYEASLTFPDNVSEYAGKIIVPSTVSIGGETYTVTEIGANAFAGTEVTEVSIPSSVTKIDANVFNGCDDLTSLTVAWHTPLATSSTLFDLDFCSDVSLNVPQNYTAVYSRTMPWMLFHKITDGTSAEEYTEWTPFAGGVGSYNFHAFWASKDSIITYKNLPVNIRTNKDDANACQVLVSNWAMGETNFIIAYNKTTRECQVPSQSANFDISYKVSSVTKTSTVWVSDMPTYNKKFLYKDYPCTYDPVSGVFSLYVVYYVPEGTFFNGVETLTGLSAPSSITPINHDERFVQSDKVYNLQGIRLDGRQLRGYNGIVIQNGKKVLIGK